MTVNCLITPFIVPTDQMGTVEVLSQCLHGDPEATDPAM